MRTHYHIAATQEGNLDELLAAPAATPAAPTLDEVLDTMAGLAFIVETVAHLQGKERELLPTSDKARRMIDFFRPTEDNRVTLGQRLMPGCTCGATPESNRCSCD